MNSPLVVGSFVCHDDHEAWGQGIVIDTSKGYVTVFFESGDSPKFNATTRSRLVVLDVADVPADSPLRTPRGRAGLAERRRRSRAEQAERLNLPGGLQAMVRHFLTHFPAGFDDPKYLREEQYKVDDLARAAALLAPVPSLVEAGDWSSAVEAFGRAVGLTNLVHTFEKVKARAISAGQREAVARAVAGVMASQPDDLGPAVEALGSALRPDGADKWTVVSWVACASHPTDPSCPMLKPRPIQAAAEALGFDLAYAAQPNARTWGRGRALYGQLAAQVEAAGLGSRSALELYTLIWYGSGLADENIARR
jgi:hypothetical protein